MRLRCLTALLLFAFFWKSPDTGKESFAYRGYVASESGRFVVLTKPHGNGAVCAAWEIGSKSRITIDGKESMDGQLRYQGSKPMDIRMTVKIPESGRPSTSLGGGIIVSMELTTIEDLAGVNSVCSPDMNIVKASI